MYCFTFVTVTMANFDNFLILLNQFLANKKPTSNHRKYGVAIVCIDQWIGWLISF